MDGVHFGIHQDQNFYKLDYQFLVKVARHVQRNQKKKLLNFCNILWKSIATAFMFYCDPKHSDTLLGSSLLYCYLFRGGSSQNGHGLLDHETLKSAVSQESELIKWADFLACWYTFRKVNVNLVIIGWACRTANNGRWPVITGPFCVLTDQLFWIVRWIFARILTF